MEVKIKTTKLNLVCGDITQQNTDAIVNAANETLLGGGGVDGAIHRAGGREILEECKKIPEVQPGVRCPTGEARITSAGKLQAKYVVHTVGPVWSGGSRNEENLLRNAYWNSLKLAVEHNIKSVSFPSISTGAYRFPIEKASKIALKTVKEFLEKEKHNLVEVRFVLFTEKDLQVYETSLKEIIH